MQTVINNNERVFQVVDSWHRGVFCNLADLNAVIKQIDDNVTIYHFWNSRREKASKMLLEDMFEAQGLTKEF